MLEIRVEGFLAFFVLTLEAVDVIVLHTEWLWFPDRFLYFCLMFLVSGVQQSAAYLIYEKIQIHSGSVVSEQLGMFLDEGYDVVGLLDRWMEAALAVLGDDVLVSADSSSILVKPDIRRITETVTTVPDISGFH